MTFEDTEPGVKEWVAGWAAPAMGSADIGAQETRRRVTTETARINGKTAVALCKEKEARTPIRCEDVARGS